MSQLLKSRSRNSAFTLVELLIVIAIIGILASLATVGVMKALEKGKMVAARTELSQLEAAIAAAKQNLSGVDNLPSAIRLYNTPAGFNTDTLGVSTANFLTKAFGKAWQSSPSCFWMGAGYTGTYPVTLTGMEALVYWLGGVRDGSGTFQGFSSNPSTPWDTTNPKYKIKGPFYEFDAVRVLLKNIDPLTGKTSNQSGSVSVPTFVNSWNGSYAYFSSSDYAGFTTTPYSTTGGSISPLLRTATAFYNPKTFQIISSGPDQTFGSGGAHTPGSGQYANSNSVFGFDDLANFSSTQLGKKDE